MAVITLAEYKVLAGITGTDQDTRLSAIIVQVQADIINECNFAFGTDLDPIAESWDSGMKMLAAQMITYQAGALGADIGIKSESIDGFSYTRAEPGASGYPLQIERKIEKYRRVSAKAPTIMTQFRDRRDNDLCDLVKDKPLYSIPGIPLEDSDD